MKKCDRYKVWRIMIAQAALPLIWLPPSFPVNGEKDAVVDHFANHRRCRKGTAVAATFFLPVYGEKCPAGQ
ncbi:hypothetical protein LHFGNBLO_000968 [Mesorhizobium sp. AR10]|uniref:hypothetical protein n=1 Tax=Mesorhizobium sp. AR10 TaxID=2865839 RepID=UPI00215EC670|nr:hypothetical protein [Mesorhizobium sp. AR10]UVK39582.1 hypothetical protein LHFGNBLO_000968 [Mesorhizobium sp. AR10]